MARDSYDLLADMKKTQPEKREKKKDEIAQEARSKLLRLYIS